MELISTQFKEHNGQLVEESLLKSCIPQASIMLEECTPVPQAIIDVLREAGLYKETPGWDEDNQGFFEATLELPQGLVFSLMRPSRGEAIECLEMLEQMLIHGSFYPEPIEAEITFFPEEDEEASLHAGLELEGMGRVTVMSEGENLQQALKIFRQVAPRAYLDS